ncbi:MAG: tetratricopeptide repeat protein [Planctomycetota bacterium]
MDSEPMDEIERHRRAGELFLEVCDLPHDERLPRVDAACGDDAQLRALVLELLAADETEDGRFDEPVIEIDGLDLPAAPRDPDAIGPYRILGRLGQGGMGIVYDAEQEHPARRVALKVLGSSFAGPELLRRFEFEARVLGRLKHPGIAQIYEAGTADVAGRDVPYFAMELVEGRPLVAAVLAERPVGERLELVARIADAVHHAHQRGVVHRDLKPSNVLVTDDGWPKVVDFGVATVTEADVTIGTRLTTPGEIIGTLAYMSPEQVRGDVAAVDTRSDVYALGVILYELLTGELPHAVRGEALAVAARRLQEDDPTRPSAHDPRLAGDVETIVLKALERDPERRYASAEELGNDLRRFLRHEPIEARPPTLRYQLRRAARRHRALFAAGGVLAVVVVTASIVSTTLMFRAMGAEGDAKRELARANEKADSARRVAALMVELFQSSDPETSQGAPRTAQEILEDGAERVLGSLRNEPEIRAELLDAIGQAFMGLALFDPARVHLEQSLELRESLYPESTHPLGHVDLLASLVHLGTLEAATSRFDEAEALLGRARAMHVALGGEDADMGLGIDTALAGVEHRLGRTDDASRRIESALQAALPRLGEDDSQVVAALRTATFLQLNSGDVAPALARLERIVERLPAEASEGMRAGILQELGKARELSGDAEGALECYARARDLYASYLEDDHRQIANASLRVGDAYFAMGDARRAEEAYRGALARWESRAVGPDLGVATALAHLADLLQAMGRHVEELEIRQRVLEIDVAIHGEEHAQVYRDFANLGVCAASAGRLQLADELQLEALALAPDLFGEVSDEVALTLHNLAELARARGEADLARERFEASLQVHGSLDPPDPSARASVLEGLGWACVEDGLWQEGIDPLSEALELGMSDPDTDPFQLVFRRLGLAECLERTGDAAAAAPLVDTVLEVMRPAVVPDDPYLRQAVALDRRIREALRADD